MKHKLLVIFALFFAAALTANAQSIAGTYTGTLEVEVLFPPTDESELVPDTEIVITAEESGTYKLSVLNFTFFGIELGDLVVTEITASENNGVVVLTKEGSSIGPDVELDLGFPVTLYTFIYLNSVVVENGQLTLDLSVTATSDEIDETLPVANVTFSGNITTGIFTPRVETASIFLDNATGIITVAGVETANFSIFSQSGALVKAGKLIDGTINVSSLRAGFYILSINGSSAKFIKK